MVDNQENWWPIIKWAIGIMTTINFTLGRWIFGNIQGTLEKHGIAIESIKNDLTVMKLDVHAVKNQNAIKEHIIDDLEEIKEMLRSKKSRGRGEVYD